MRLSLALRVVVVLLAFQLSGLGHALADVVLFTDDPTAEHDSDCSNDPGKDCPPGCPSCHHPGGGVGSLPQRFVGTVNTHFSDAPIVASVPAEADAPISPDLPSVFRPPRTA